ncbi:MAG: hypothetical protein KGL35_25350 [Bradyrhizobium sp.]|nr:hypothetical protein [Bradyrhizobium sp.]
MIVALCVVGYLVGVGVAAGIAMAMDFDDDPFSLALFWPLAIVALPVLGIAIGTERLAALPKHRAERRRAEARRIEQLERELSIGYDA